MLFNLSMLVTTRLAIELDPQDFIDKLFPSGITPFIVQISAMVVLVTAFFVFFFKPVRKILDARKEKMMSDLNDASKKSNEATTMLTNAQQEIKNSKVQAAKIITDAKKDAEMIIERTNIEAKEEVIRMKKEAEKDIEMSKEQAHDDINKSIVEVALKASEKVLGREVEEEDNRRLIDDFLKGIDN